MNPPPPSRNERDLLIVVKLASALGMGTLAAFLYSLKEVHPHIRFEFSLGTVLIALGIGAASWIFCGVMARADSEEKASLARKRFFIRWVVVFGGLATAGTAIAFIVSLRNVSSRGQREVLEGTIMALLVIAAGAFLIHKAFRFFEEQDKASLDERDDRKHDADE
ncbi:MAG: hypothetical protein QOF48_1767 [Verrucomicrobiota bacterium]|jgi:hypothetical protein